jgi:hypothetical protein
MVEFPDGNVVYGTSAEDLMDRWGRLMSWGAERSDPFPPRYLKRVVYERLDAIYGVEGPAPELPDEDWLEGLNATNVIVYINKDG